ncbi:MAG: hypothetical protein JSW10_06600 [Pseudomonadota bacterium]|nr:MAG: hypothetical protein JSW10_06600 [Pseudomonadota bacterium]
MFRYLRITILLALLVVVAAGTWLTKLRTTDWDAPLWVAIHPINGDGSDASSRYITSLDVRAFRTLEDFFGDEAESYDLALKRPITVQLAHVIDEMPPTPPAPGNTLAIMAWSLQMRYWAYRVDHHAGPTPDIRIFVVYHDPVRHERLRHSLGLEKGLVGVVNAFASPTMAEKNNVIIAHELLHTVGATDKYGVDELPLHPAGYAEPDKRPLYPQNYAEIMGGRIPVDQYTAVIPRSLHKVVIGEQTAREINWLP